MNYLAHLQLSHHQPALLTGNFMGDFVKGKNYMLYPEEIKNGVLLHRFIDHFTDTHPLVLEAKQLIRHRHGHWSGVVMDMFFDHFLAANFEQWEGESLESYTQKAYAYIADHEEHLPERASHIYYYMSRDNWLLTYATEVGIAQALAGISSRVRHENQMNRAYEDLKAHGEQLHGLFNEFYQELTQASDEKRLAQAEG
ncbi:ACP phosphodiesterase [Persicobacter diffluens]|uniref:ACP phosphodiesterase n=1 Tax=Persicobacter diffluens TaxID=981 RepID=A0AAN4VXU8_9BACT|nr:ACP phosphodiesterase [Persicobacter diffluens]